MPDGLAEIDVDAVRAAQAAVREAVRDGALSSAHDIAEGGLAVALAECCLAGGLGAEIALDADVAEALGAADDAETVLFGEGPGGFLVSGAAASLDELATRAPLHRLGTVAGDSLAIEAAGEGAILASLEDLERAHGKLAELFG